MDAAVALRPLVDAALGTDLPVRVDCWDGSSVGPSDADVVVRFTNRRAVRRLVWAPNELGFARAYVSGDVELDGDLLDALTRLDELGDPERGPGVRVGADTRAAVAKAVVRLGALGPPPRPPTEEIRLSGRRHDKRRDARAVSHHYDVGNDFYELVLGPSMVYSCAYFEQAPSPTFTLEHAQRAKLELVAHKLGLGPGVRLLDVGCGWGSFVIHAAREYGVSAVGVTLSEEQATYARDRVESMGLADRVEIRVQDYRDVPDGPFDAIASIGMAEHVGTEKYSRYAAALYSLLKPAGRLLNHQIARRPGSRESGSTFITSYVFPDGELAPVGTTVSLLEEAGFEVRDVESLREHYARTLRRWVANLEADWDDAVRLASPGRARVWRIYMAGSALAFEANRIGVNQIVAVRATAEGRSGMPVTRAAWLGAASAAR
jgi:cyclopropane-fatty-acyl-phospholipid synthase